MEPEEKQREKQRIPGKYGGSLNPGGTPGNKGGGRPKNEVRNMCQDDFETLALPRLRAILKNPKSRDDAVIRTSETLGKFAGLTQTDITSGDQPSKVIILTSDVQAE